MIGVELAKLFRRPRTYVITLLLCLLPLTVAIFLATTRIPPLLDPHDIYAADRPGLLSPEARLARPLVYVPDSEDETVTVIDQRTRKIVRVVHTGRLPQHVTPSYDLKTLYVDNDLGDSLTTIDPRTGTIGRKIHVDDPYNLYFTADGEFAVVVAEAKRRLDFYDANSFHRRHRLALPCKGIDHLDFSADGTHALVSCEFASKLVYVDMVHQRLAKQVPLPEASAPQDVKLSPDGKTYYVADMQHGGVYLIDADRNDRNPRVYAAAKSPQASTPISATRPSKSAARTAINAHRSPIGKTTVRLAQ